MKIFPLLLKIASKYLQSGTVLAVVFFVSTPVFAKDITIEWKTIKGALKYEFAVERNGAVYLHKIVDETKWSGDLPFGFYAYRLRAIDKLKRGGSWSEVRALVVMPAAPKPEYPKNGDRVT